MGKHHESIRLVCGALLLSIMTGFGVYNMLIQYDELNARGLQGRASTILMPFEHTDLIAGAQLDSELRVHGASSAKSAQVPTVLAPGMGDSCFNPGFAQVTSIVAGRTNKDAYCIGPGGDAFTDPVYSFTKTMNEQVENFAKKVKANVQLAKGFNAMGLSQGNLIIRGYIQRYNDPPVLSFVSVHGPHAGVASIPRCDPGVNAIFKELCNLLDYLLSDFVYTSAVQTAVAQSNYFREPFKIPSYLKGCAFLPDVLERATLAYKQRLVQLKHLVLVYAERDTMIFPKETALFGSFAAKSYSKLVTAEQQPWFESLGLKELKESGRIAELSTKGDHLRFSIADLNSWIDTYFLT